MWLTIAFRTSFALTSLPMPVPGMAVSLAMTERSRFPWRTISSTRRSGVPTPMNPPISRLAPLGIKSTASPRDVVFIFLPYARNNNILPGILANSVRHLSEGEQARDSILARLGTSH